MFQGPSMTRFGLHGKLIARPGERDALVQIMLTAARLVSDAPGCQIYFVSTSTTEPDTIWVTEVWRSEEDHKASLTLPAIKDLITKGRPLLAGAPEQIFTTPVGGKGLPAA
jgi:quinol monooxygenase YgiN